MRFPVRWLLLALPLFLGLTSAPGLAQGSCFPNATQLCLHYSRFQVEVDWMLPGGVAGKGQAVPLTNDTGSFWFFDNSNLELLVKVLDGRPVNGHFWVFYGGLSNVEYRLTVTDTATGVQEIYVNPAGRMASVSDTTAFDPEPLGFPSADDSALPDRAPSRLGPELLVNATTKGNQGSPAVAVGPDGGFLITWLGDPGGVQGRFYDSAGRPRSGEIAVSPGAYLPGQARVAADASGRFMVVWNDRARVWARIYGPDTLPVTEPFAVGFSPQIQGYPDVVADPAGGFLVAWPEEGDHTLRLQRFRSQGSLVGNEIAITRPGVDVRLAAYPAGGGFLLAWTEGSFTLGFDVRLLRLDTLGQPTSSTAAQVNTDTVRHTGYPQAPVPVVHPDGGYSVLWTNQPGGIPNAAPGLFVRRYGADGQSAGGVRQLVAGIQVDNWEGNALSLPSGEVMVLWYERGRAEDLDGGLFGRLYDASWQPRGSSFRINTYTQNDQILPAVAADAAGNIITAWTSAVDFPLIPIPPDLFPKGQDGDGSGVFAQRFSTAGCAGPDQLCLGGRFAVAVQYTDPDSGQARTAHAAPLTGDTGAFWFFSPSNAELLIKVLDGRPVNGAYWVFYGALSDVEYMITVTDTVTGNRRTYHNSAHHQASAADVGAFPAP